MVSYIKPLTPLILAVGAFAGGAAATRQYIKGNVIYVDPELKATGKVAIVTGANSGIGKETAKELARRGATVYMACRSETRCAEAREEIIRDTKNANVHCRYCDLEDFQSITQFADSFKGEQKRLDILINNAATVQSVWKHTDSYLSKHGIELQLGVNHVGHFLLTSLLLDTLKKSAPSRVIVVSCFSHEVGHINLGDINSEMSYHPTFTFDQSKIANILFATRLAKKLEGSGVTVNSVNPGVTATALGGQYNFIDDGGPSQKLTRPIFEWVAKSPYQGAQTSIYAALDPSLEKATGKYFSDCSEKEAAPHATNIKNAEELWRLTENLIREKSAKAVKNPTNPT